MKLRGWAVNFHSARSLKSPEEMDLKVPPVVRASWARGSASDPLTERTWIFVEAPEVVRRARRASMSVVEKSMPFGVTKKRTAGLLDSARFMAEVASDRPKGKTPSSVRRAEASASGVANAGAPAGMVMGSWPLSQKKTWNFRSPPRLSTDRTVAPMRWPNESRPPLPRSMR